ncbi:MAG: triose-phosphate isomerase [Candidatus Aenigmarchaeota archaeon]|nr:triose-phosphate isomerase [Candidatus Aenigmarchaeota archaeon]
MELPLILVNFKTYVEGTGKGALKLAKICEVVSKKFNVNIAIAPQFTDIRLISSKVKIPIFAQHIDYQEPGAFTGHISALAIKGSGAAGTLINHSERRLSLKEIKKCTEIAKKYDLISVVCSDSLMKGRNIARFDPDFIAYEDPLLIGTGEAISKVKPNSVRNFVKTISRINPEVKVLCGAGITSGEDVKRAIELGTKGVLVASSIVKATNPKKVLIEFAKAIQE